MKSYLLRLILTPKKKMKSNLFTDYGVLKNEYKNCALTATTTDMGNWFNEKLVLCFKVQSFTENRA
jgi:hypothetical protein